MSGEPIITVTGNVTGDPELRFTQAGKAVASFTVAQTPRTKQGDTWADGTTTWFRCSAWDRLAENVVESITKGTRVIVQGRLSTREYETREGAKGSSLDLQVDAIGPELRFATARVVKGDRSGGQQGGQQQRPQSDPWSAPAQQSDPWAAPANTGGGDPWAGGTGSDEPPF